MASDRLTGTTIATVREWWAVDGWGVLDSADTPGGCWTHFSHIEMTGYRELHPGQVVELDWESPGQDGYEYRAVRVRITGLGQNRTPIADQT